MFTINVLIVLSTVLIDLDGTLHAYSAMQFMIVCWF